MVTWRPHSSQATPSLSICMKKLGDQRAQAPNTRAVRAVCRDRDREETRHAAQGTTHDECVLGFLAAAPWCALLGGAVHRSGF